MNYLESMKLRESREYEAAERLSSAVNSMSWDPKKFAQAISMQHRTLQQEIMRTFVALLHVMASEDYRYDDRNRGSHEAARKMIESGILDEIYLPFI